jgi:hypothetical protein
MGLSITVEAAFCKTVSEDRAGIFSDLAPYNTRPFISASSSIASSKLSGLWRVGWR